MTRSGISSPTIANGIHDLVFGLDTVFSWDGNKYKKKEK